MPSSAKRILEEDSSPFGKHEPVDIQLPEDDSVGQLSASFGGKVPSEQSKSRILAILDSLSGGAVKKQTEGELNPEDDLQLVQAVPMA